MIPEGVITFSIWLDILCTEFHCSWLLWPRSFNSVQFSIIIFAPVIISSTLHPVRSTVRDWDFLVSGLLGTTDLLPRPPKLSLRWGPRQLFRWFAPMSLTARPESTRYITVRSGSLNDVTGDSIDCSSILFNWCTAVVFYIFVMIYPFQLSFNFKRKCRFFTVLLGSIICDAFSHAHLHGLSLS